MLVKLWTNAGRCWDKQLMMVHEQVLASVDWYCWDKQLIGREPSQLSRPWLVPLSQCVLQYTVYYTAVKYTLLQSKNMDPSNKAQYSAVKRNTMQLGQCIKMQHSAVYQYVTLWRTPMQCMQCSDEVLRCNTLKCSRVQFRGGLVPLSQYDLSDRAD